MVKGGKISFKSRLFLFSFCFIIFFNLGFIFAESYNLSGAYSLTPYIMSINETSEVIRFETNVPVNATINYGINSVNEYSISNTSFGKKNEFLITNLVPGTKYKYQVVISNVTNGLIYTDSFFNASFKTSSNNQNSFSFAVIGDSQVRGSNVCGTNQTELAKVINRLVINNVDFVLFTGDIIEGYNSSTINCSQFNSYWSSFHNVTGDLRKQIPFIATNGNHENIDRGGNVSWQNYWVLPNNARGRNGVINETAYSWRYDNTLFVALNTVEVHDELHYGNITGDQFNWFNQTIIAEGYTNKFIFTHIPLAGDFSMNSLSSPAYAYPVKGNPIRSAMFDSLMYSNGVTAVFAGHQHYYCRNISRFGSPIYLVNGAVGDYQHWLNCAGYAGYNSSSVYTIINVTPKAIYGKVYDLNGIVVDSYILSVLSRRGNGNIDIELGEECDDGNYVSGDGCSSEFLWEDCTDLDSSAGFDKSFFNNSLVWDSGIKYDDYCLDNSSVKEYYCTKRFWLFGDLVAKSKDLNCPKGCFGGRCLELNESFYNCIDSDKSDIYSFGNVNFNNETYFDFCANNQTILEYTCINDQLGFEYRACDAGICLDGACILSNSDIPLEPNKPELLS